MLSAADNMEISPTLFTRRTQGSLTSLEQSFADYSEMRETGSTLPSTARRVEQATRAECRKDRLAVGVVFGVAAKPA
jgi:hypothetical protein